MSIHWMNEGDFVSLVTEEMEIFEGLLKLARMKFEALTGGNVSGLSRIVEQEEKLTSDLATLEGKRAVFVAGVVPLLSLEDATLSGIAERFSPGFREALSGMKERWRETLIELRELHVRNQRLLESAMRLLEIRLKAFRMAVRDHRYSRKGERLHGQGSLLLNRRA